MSLPSTWRQFQLFDFLPIRDPNYQSEFPLFSDPSLSSITATSSYIVFAYQNAYIRLLDKSSLESVMSFCAYNLDYKITFMKPLLNSNLLVTLAESQGSPAIIKVWDLHKITQLSGSTVNDDDAMKHKFVTQVQVLEGDNSYPISCFAFNDTLTCLALGYTNGKIILVRGDMLRDRGAKQRVIYESNDPITGVFFNRFEEIIYVTTISQVLTLLTTGRNQGKPHRVLSKSEGADLGCSDLEYRTSKLITGNSEALKYYNHVSRSSVINFNVPKRKILRLFKDYLLIVCPIEEASSEDNNQSTNKTLTRLLILDLKNMHISFSLTIPNSTISHVFSSNNDNNVFLLSTDGVLYKLHEKAINQQLETIIQRELFGIALNLAHQNNLDDQTNLRINRLYGDFLYKKGDYDGAIEKYMSCLPLFKKGDKIKVDATDDDNLDDFIVKVLMDFKQVSNVRNMTKFLAELHKLNLADSDHVTLLLCCYCKLDMVKEIDSFIKEMDVDGTTQSESRLDYDKLNYALFINLFKECGYYSQVTRLLLKLNRPYTIVDIHLNELNQYDECINYIRTLPIDEILRILIDFSQTLLQNKPMETTELLINVFTGQYKPDKRHDVFENSERVQPDAQNEEPKPKISSYEAFIRYLSGTSTGNGSVSEPGNDEPTYQPPRPSLVFHCFIGHEREFVVFLEACLETFDKYQGNVNDKKDLLVTLFEIYLSMSSKDSADAGSWKAKAKELLMNNGDLIDKSKALVISYMYNFTEGETVINELTENFEEASFQSCQMLDDVQGCLNIVRKYGERKPKLYKLMINYLGASNEGIKLVSNKEFLFLLERIKHHRLLSPLETIKALSGNPHATVGMVRDYLIDHFEQTQKQIKNNDKLIDSYEHESTMNSLALTELTTDAMVVKNSKCNGCELRLEFPVIYFKCKHAYHQRCLNENIYIPETTDNGNNDPKCPLCVNEISSSELARERQLRVKEETEIFKQQLDESNDKFKVICDYIGKGAME
ncbi:hypothetical_protein [Candidozyma auris]|uniref:tethering complex subunit PEP5 n=1 Tax=Candidozyma auris TaxID=498019 RepID=UPI000D2D6CF6|nr:tethering complex subunit PEP5 [[Candida] auris]XP_054558226.1 hypothetical_protein [[Candida] auris]QEO23899.1 hypothetical_protein [[Candida] auris]QEO23957.1 hypothetical_protein [[Candida] auris]GBL52812.1 hypothetical protein CAJCM15448_50860 [[Candida] auris]